MEKEITSVEDTYTVTDEYNSITSKLSLLDDGELRASLLEKAESRYDYFKEIIAGMGDEISRYEAVQAEEKKLAQEQAAKDAENKRAQEEKNVKKQTFMQALERIENLEYQEMDLAKQELLASWKWMLRILYLTPSTSFPLLQEMRRKLPFPQDSSLLSPVSPRFLLKVSGMLPRPRKNRRKKLPKNRLTSRFRPSSVSCALP